MLRRRRFIKGLTTASVLAATAPLFSCADSGGSDGSDTITVYRFQTRTTQTCNACRNHQHYKVFADEDVANRTRAHAGCNCRIVPQEVTGDYWDTIAAFERDGVVDLRAVFA